MKKFSLWFITTALRIYFRLTLRMHLPPDGFDKIPARGPLIIITNHTGQVEVPVLATLLQPTSGDARVDGYSV